MRKKSAAVLLSTLLPLTALSSISDAETLQSMTQEQVLKALQDKTIKTIQFTILKNKLIPNQLVAYLSPQGKIIGRFYIKPQNLPQMDEGTWTVKKNGLLCATWQHWNNQSENCVYVFDAVNSLLFVGKDKTLNTVVLDEQIMSGNQIQKIKMNRIETKSTKPYTD